MHLSISLVQKQEQSLYMTQELRQAIKILQLSSQDLLTYLQEISFENPLIEIETNLHDYSTKFQNADVSELTKRYDFIMQNLSQTKLSLQDFLLSQLGELQIDPKLKKIITWIIHHLDEKGYFTANSQEFCSQYQISEDTLQKALTVLQSFEPIGIGATSLQQCILIQLRHLKDSPPLAEQIIENYYELFITKKWDQLAKMLSISPVEIQQVADLIKTVNLRPAEFYVTEQPQYIIPDLYVEKLANDLIVYVNDELLPAITFNEQYVSMIDKTDADVPSKFMKEKFEQARWLVNSMEQRKKTLFAVAKAIIDYQKDFFLTENSKLKPLTLKDIANIVGIHESTVSRAIHLKYVQTPKGLFELKSFFSTAIKTVDGEKTSALMVKEQIRSIINSENKQTPYSDSQIVKLLKERNIQISRRTVAKYREELGIGSSKVRKRY